MSRLGGCAYSVRNALMKKKLLFVGLTMVGTLYTSCAGQAIAWFFTGAWILFAAP